MSVRFNENLYPDGGRFFKDADGVTHKGSSFKSLIKTVRDYRERNKFEAGDPELEITTQLCGRNPGYCNEAVPRVPAPKQGKPRSSVSQLGQKVMSWMTFMIQEKRRNRLSRVPRAEAKRRADICARCPRQAAFPLACGACKASVKTTEKGLLDNQSPVHDGIETCSILHEQTSTSVHFVLPPSDSDELPENCWRRK
jgi:hypothetical protein